MKSLRHVVLVVAVLFVGCVGPAEDFVRAEAGAWEQIDKHLDRWIQEDEKLTQLQKDAYDALNDARRARVRRALARFDGE